MSRPQPGQPAMQGGTATAVPVEKPAALAALIRRGKRPLLVVGHRALVVGSGEERMVDLLARAALKAGWPVAATGDAGPALAARGVEPALCATAMDLGARLSDPSWEGVDGGGPHDVVFVAGLPYALEWTLLSGLRHGPSTVVTVSLSPAYEPHASFSLGNLAWPAWRALISEGFGLEASA